MHSPESTFQIFIDLSSDPLASIFAVCADLVKRFIILQTLVGIRFLIRIILKKFIKFIYSPDEWERDQKKQTYNGWISFRYKLHHSGLLTFLLDVFEIERKLPSLRNYILLLMIDLRMGNQHVFYRFKDKVHLTRDSRLEIHIIEYFLLFFVAKKSIFPTLYVSM